MSSRFRQRLAIASTFVVICGCNVQPETLEALRQVASPSSNARSPLATQAEVTRVRVTFDPTYPERVDPFTFPDESNLESPATDTSIQSAAQLDVVGFANLGQPRVFLRARDRTYSLVVGEKIDGVEVVEIRPPTARLRMGGVTWTTSMFDKASP